MLIGLEGAHAFYGSTPPKIDQLVAEAKAELKRLGIDTEGKRPDQLLTMAREARIHPRVAPKPE